MIPTPFTAIFGVRHPIVCGGMTGIGTADLIAAVAEAGALGFLTALTQPTPEALAKEIVRTRDLTDQEFGVNLSIVPTLQPVPYDEYRAVIVESQIGVVETAGGNPAFHLPDFTAAGIKVIHKATTVRHALSAQALGVDAVTIDCFECAGHLGDGDVGAMVLIPAAAKALDIPVIASGGIATGAGLVAALALGASAVTMGTRFMASTEALIHPNVKQMLVANDETDTVIVFREFQNSARVARNAVSMEIAEISKQSGADFADVAELASGVRGREAVLERGDMDGGMWWASQSQGLIESIDTCEAIVTGIVRDAEDIISGLPC